MMRECEVWMYYNKAWRRFLDRILYGHWKHVCIIERQFMMSHEGNHVCKCGKSWMPISTDND